MLAGGAIYWLIRSRKQETAIFACLVLAALTYLPVSGIFLLNANVAEHWIYLPAAFLFLAAGLTISRFSIPPLVLGSALVVWFLFLGARTWMRTFDWKDQRTFLERTLASGGDSDRMLINLAGLELSEGKLDLAKQHLALALRKEPNQPLAILNLAWSRFDKTTSPPRAICSTARRRCRWSRRGLRLLAVLEHKEKGPVDRMRFRLAARTGPPNWSIEKRYIEVLDQIGDTAAAIAELKSCLATQWYRAESWQLLSELLTKTGNATEAAWARERAEASDVHFGRAPAFLTRSGRSQARLACLAASGSAQSVTVI